MAKLTMTVFDIVQQYMMSADRERQIEILADLNLCSQDDIREVLADAGCMLPEKKKRAAASTCLRPWVFPNYGP